MLRYVRLCTQSNTHLQQDLLDKQQANCRHPADNELIMSHPIQNIAELFSFTVQKRGTRSDKNKKAYAI